MQIILIARGIVVVAVLLFMFISSVTTEERAYDVRIDNAGDLLELSSEQLLYEQELTRLGLDPRTVGTQQEYTIDLINTSGTPGVAADVAVKLLTKEYAIASVTHDAARTDERTVIVYDVALQDEALALNERIGNTLLSARTSTEDKGGNITIYLGKDRLSR